MGFTMDNTKKDNVPTVIYADNQAVIQSAEGIGNLTLPGFAVQTMRTTALIAEKYAQIKYRHVHAHDLNPYNEAADSIAKAASTSLIQPDEADFCPAAYVLQNAPQFLPWLAFASAASNSEEFPQLNESIEGTRIHITGFAANPDTCCVEIPEFLRTKAKVPPQGSVRFIVATLNVLTLNDDKKQQAKAQQHRQIIHQQRAGAVYAQFHYHKVAIACLQEPRLKKSRRTQNKHYYIFTSASDGPANLGAQIIVAKTISYATVNDKFHYFQQNDFHVVAYSSTYIILRISAKYLQCYVVSAHAPHGARKDKQILQEWWKEFARQIAALRRDVPIILGIDANSTVGEVVTAAVGPCGAEQQNEAAEHFHEFLLKQSLVLPSTFNHTGTQITYVKDGGKRLDYIALSQDLHPAVTKSFIIDDFVLQVDDHMPAAVEMRLHPVDVPETICTRRVTKIDRAKVKDPARRAAFEADFGQIQQDPVPWEVDVNEHCAIRQLQVRQCAEKWFPTDKHKKQRRYIQQDTWDLILAQKSCKRAIKYISRIRHLWQNQSIFTIWAKYVAKGKALSPATGYGAPKYPIAAFVMTIFEYRCRRRIISSQLSGLPLPKSLRLKLKKPHKTTINMKSSKACIFIGAPSQPKECAQALYHYHLFKTHKGIRPTPMLKAEGHGSTIMLCLKRASSPQYRICTRAMLNPKMKKQSSFQQFRLPIFQHS